MTEIIVVFSWLAFMAILFFYPELKRMLRDWWRF